MRFVPDERLSNLQPFEGNPRTHSAASVQAVANSMKKFGWTNPILVQEGTGRVLAGHGRILAAQKNGIDTAPVVYLQLSDDEASAYTIVDNQSATLSDWDEERLVTMVRELSGEGFDLSVLGFEESFLQDLLGQAPDPPVPEEETVKQEFGVYVKCENEARQVALIERLENEGYACRALIS